MRTKALGCECPAFGQYLNGVVAVQAFLVAGNDTKITNALVCAQRFAEQARGVFDKNWIGHIRFSKRLFVFAFDHHLRFRWHRQTGKRNQIFEPKHRLFGGKFYRNPRDRPLRMRRRQAPTRFACVFGKFKRVWASR